MTRWLHPSQLDRPHTRDLFDPVAEGLRHGLDRELSLAIWQRACAEATDVAGRLDLREARQRFHELAARVAARPGGPRPAIGKLTRVGIELDGVTPVVSAIRELAAPTPGRETRVAVEARRWANLRGEPAVASEAEPSDGAEGNDRGVVRSDLRGADPVTQAMVALQPSAQPAPAETGPAYAPMSRLFDVDRLALFGPWRARDPRADAAVPAAAPSLSDRRSVWAPWSGPTLA